ncbi:MmcQ/YjbR family DNA-binding protein [Dawidia soli]|uniref:MmcQ/YjbR family DNA-binding protein n=1 Tax=Dawidia soli TaxID=2782352 RepID=A0AAP2D6A8_9BACT|nr:MmcQ/YjbR family DNA-binding protein [Dawidia soli]MBT1685859.1 MmcQ/YjbR family DNA-binding protein [Dawidia soli]
MDLEQFMRWCNAKKGVTEEFPFGEEILVYKVMGKMFALTNVDQFDSINLKVEPEQGVLLQEEYAAVQPGYHMNKKHWITVTMDGSVPNRLLQQWIDNSYNLVVSGLTKKQQTALKEA